MVAGIILIALGMKVTLGHYGDPLGDVPAFAMLGGTAIYLLAHVVLRLRNAHSINRQRLYSRSRCWRRGHSSTTCRRSPRSPDSTSRSGR